MWDDVAENDVTGRGEVDTTAFFTTSQQSTGKDSARLRRQLIADRSTHTNIVTDSLASESREPARVNGVHGQCCAYILRIDMPMTYI